MAKNLPLSAPDLAQGSPERFGFSWNEFNALSSEQFEQFRRWTAPLSPDVWRGATFLDGGCGAGRNSVFAVRMGAAGGVAVDVDERSLAAARRNLIGSPSVQVEFRSLYDLGAPDRFDIAFSIGVIHHLADPGRAVGELARVVKPGGKVLVWLYGYENMEFYVEVLDRARRILFSRLPVSWVSWLAHMPAVTLWALLRCGWRPIEYFRLLAGFPYRHLHHIVFDQMLPRVSRYYRREQAAALLFQAGLVDVETVWINEMSWTVVGTKPFRPGTNHV